MMLVSLAVPAQAATLAIPQKTTSAIAFPLNPDEYGALLLLDEKSGKILYAHHADQPWTAASLTKLMTARTFASTPTNWDATGSILSADEVGGGRLRVNSGTLLSLKDVLYSAIIGSANNAAQALARMFDARPTETFITEMNTLAKRFGLAQTVFYDASGMNEKNTLSAFDIATIFIEATDVQEVADSMVLPTYTFSLRSPVSSKTIKNTNDLLFVEPDIIVTGGKTGYLIESKYNLIVRAYPKDSPEESVIAVVLGSDTRKGSFDAIVDLMKWGWDQYDWVTVDAPVAITDNYELGDRDPEIRSIQAFLNANGFTIASSGAGSPGQETEYFGSLTQKALERFQNTVASTALTPRGATSASGYVDSLTRYAMHSYQAKVATVSAGTTSETSASIASSASNESFNLPAMGRGSVGESVRILQTLLAKDPGVYPEGLITGYFGSLTEKAVQRFQIAHDVVQSSSDAGYGYVGPATRAKLDQLY